MLEDRNLEYWIEQWQKKQQDAIACNLFWDKKAKSYSEYKSKRDEKINPVLELLKEKGILKKSSKVLDIGCGPGTHAIAMARECQEVVALDISQEMLQYLDKNIKREGLNNIKYYKLNWEKVDLSEYKWEKKFDLVFANMTPGIYNYSTFKKMLDASKGYCYLSGFIQREDQLWDALDKEIVGKVSFNREMGDKIYYAFNILWNLGYYPEIIYKEREWEEEGTLKEMIDLFKGKFQVTYDIQEKDIKKIEEFLFSHEKDGKIIEKTRAKTATLIWKV